jgi:uncharacterized protein (TIRG00374 family)
MGPVPRWWESRANRAVILHIVRRLIAAGKYSLALALLVWLVWSGRLEPAALASGHMPGLHALGLSVRWWRLLALQGIALPFPRALRITWIGYFYALLLPGIGGGDVVRGLYVFREASGAKLRATATVLVDRAVGLYASLCLAGIALVETERWRGASDLRLQPIRLTVLALLVLCSAASALFLWGRSRRFLVRFPAARLAARLSDIAEAFAAQRRTLGSCFLLSLASSASFLAAFWVAGRVLPVDLSATQVLLVVPLVLIANALPLSPGGVGVGETVAAVLFAACGVANGATVMLMVRVWQALVRVPGLLLQVAGGRVTRADTDPGHPLPGRSRSCGPSG